MATSYESAEVKCPFYLKNEQRKIYCEGIENESRIVVEYRGREKAKSKMKEVCGEKYKECEIYQMLIKKYE